MNAKVGQVLFTELRKIYANTYFDRAPREATFPYAVFTTPSSFYAENIFNIILRIDVYSNTGNNITSLESTVKAFIDGLKKAVYTDDDMQLMFNVESVLQIQEPDEQIRRREITFNVKYWNREA